MKYENSTEKYIFIFKFLNKFLKNFYFLYIDVGMMQV